VIIRKQLKPQRGPKLRVLVCARYSTEEQDASSIPDQDAYCRRLVDQQEVEVGYELIFDAEMSGELVSRPGIDKVRQGISERRWDLIICEDSSRLYRNVGACISLVEEAVDNGIRVICINDDVDTAEEQWLDRLVEAQSHHTVAGAPSPS
jgi:DNA invertase Pin-like site-specific DNA recombinase